MILIKVFHELDINMNKRFMYMENYYQFNNEDLGDISKLNVVNIAQILSDEENYINNEEGVFIEVENAFKSICALGQEIVENCKSINMNQLWNNLWDNKYIKKDKKIINILYNWISKNGFPYSTFSFSNDDRAFITSDLLMQFVYDSIFCYLAFEIYALYIKKKNNEENFDNEYNARIFDKINDDLKILNIISIMEHIRDSVLTIGIKGILEDYDTYDEIINTLTEGLNHENFDFYLNDYINSLISILSFTIQSRKYDFMITTQRPFYTNNEYSILDTCQSILGIAYSKLLLNITSGEIGYNIRICKNPNCNNIFESRYRQEYCNKEECQTYRKNKKSYDYYHRLTNQNKKVNHNKD